jgi:hypothetical protein
MDDPLETVMRFGLLPDVDFTMRKYQSGYRPELVAARMAGAG